MKATWFTVTLLTTNFVVNVNVGDGHIAHGTDRAEPVSFRKSGVLIQHGRESKILYLIATGRVRVSVAGGVVAQIGPGEICGEMAFLEGSVPSASAIAEDEVQAYAIEWQTLNDLFELFPHLASRFYRSLAINLSRRLREQIIPKKR